MTYAAEGHENGAQHAKDELERDNINNLDYRQEQ
jgi:hypothetical protein